MFFICIFSLLDPSPEGCDEHTLGQGIKDVQSTPLFQCSILIMDIATYRLNQPVGQRSENHLKCIKGWKGRDGLTITIFSAYKR